MVPNHTNWIYKEALDTVTNVIYLEVVIKKAMKKDAARVKINRYPICNIRYADDIELVEKIEDLQNLLDTSHEFGQSQNTWKT